mmetsp:Transcript_14361/g.46858  ORF Transcript_14361/g.46858 Transcript_14361/m.46858 type:complete len:661 (-) Transcript_14361:222-2204(-)
MEKLSRGGVQALMGGAIDDSRSVVVQVVESQKKAEKWRCKLSDGSAAAPVYATFNSQLAPMFEEGEVGDFALVRILSSVTHTMNSQSVVIVNRMSLVEAGGSVGSRIGSHGSDDTNNNGRSNNNAVSPGQQQSHAPPPKTPLHSNNSVPRVTTTSTAKPTTAKTVRSGGLLNRGGGPISRTDDSNVRTIAIANLNPYQNRWTIKARLVMKGDITHWSNAKGTGCLCKLTFADAAGDDIEAVMFREAVTKFHASFEEGKVYYVSNGRVKVANKQYSTSSSAYELMLDANSKIVEAPEDDAIAKADAATYKAITDVREVPAEAVCDVLGVVKGFDDVREVTSQKLNGRTLHKRELQLVDEGLVEIRLTLWGDQATKEPYAVGTVLGLKGVKVSDYGGKSLSALRSSRIVVVVQADDNSGGDTSNSDERATALAKWWHHQGGSSAPTTHFAAAAQQQGGLSAEQQRDAFYAAKRGEGPATDAASLAAIIKDRKPCDELRAADGDLGRGTKPDFFTLKATVTSLKTDKLWYEACPQCAKKVNVDPDGQYSCEKCSQTFPECHYRYILNFQVLDDSNSAWVSAFNEAAEAILGKTAAELAALREENDAAFDDTCDAAKGKQFLLRCRAKYETWQDVPRLKTSVTAASPVDFVREAKALIAAIDTL